MKFKYSLILSLLIALGSLPGLRAQAPANAPESTNSISAAVVIDRAIEQERRLENRMPSLLPIIETYTQTMERHPTLGTVPKKDNYFLGQLDLIQGANPKSLVPDSGWVGALGQKLKGVYSLTFVPEAFASMILLGPNFQKSQYTFTYVRPEFLGEVHCFVFDVQPAQRSSGGGFIGRIWIEDRDFNIVRFNGTRASSTGANSDFHFDSWRENTGPGLWLPSYVYTEESDKEYFMGTRKLRFKGLTRLFGYNRRQTSDALPSERNAEDRILNRLQNAGLLAGDGPVNKVLETVVNNLQITNNLNIEPPVRVRVLLTTPLESFTVGNTMVLSKGFIDVLPDEASLALVLAHELAHIYLRHGFARKPGFNDAALFADPQTFMKVFLQRTPDEENAADRAAVAFLTNSPYREKLSSAALFLLALEERSAELPNLLRPHLVTPMAKDRNVKRMSGLTLKPPKLEMERTDQIAALPLGGRIRLDPWNNDIELIRAKNPPLQSPREKMPFEVTPIYPYLTRQEKPSEQK